MHTYGVHLLWPKYMQYLIAVCIVIGVEPISLPSNPVAAVEFISLLWKPWCGGGLHLLVVLCLLLVLCLLVVLRLLVVLCLFLVLGPLVVLGPFIVLCIRHSLDLRCPPPLLRGVGILLSGR